MEFSLINILQSILAGLVSVVSPCILPVLPVILTGTEKDSKFRPLFIIAGLSLTFIILGVLSAAFGSLLAGKIQYLEQIGAVVIFIFGLMLLLEFNPFKQITALNKIEPLLQNSPDFLLGLGLGLLWIPCTGPVLSGILTMVATQASIAGGVVLLAFYSLGFAIPMLGFAYFSQFFRARSKFLLKNPKYISWASGALLIAFSLYILLF